MTHRAIYVDVDGTLIYAHGSIREGMREWLERMHAAGHPLYLWSARGRDHAIEQAALTGTTHLFAAILPKPTHILDDKAWSWIRYTRDAREL